MYSTVIYWVYTAHESLNARDCERLRAGIRQGFWASSEGDRRYVHKWSQCKTEIESTIEKRGMVLLEFRAQTRYSQKRGLRRDFSEELDLS